jgi:hypothetical protein
MRRISSAFLLFLTVAAFAVPASAKWRTVRCLLESEGARFAGRCSFMAVRDGSFALKPLKPYRSLLGATIVSVAMAGDGTAEVRGLTRDGINSRWGDVRRSRRERGCWEGDGIKICAW